MPRYNLTYKPSIKQDFRGIPRDDLEIVIGVVKGLKDNPFPDGVAKIKSGTNPYYRIRHGLYRIGYRVFKKTRTIDIIFIRCRDEKTYRP